MIRRRGFTLLEAAVALLIIGLAASGVISAFGAHTRGAARAIGRLESAALAQHVLAELRLAEAHELEVLPDSLGRGTFAPPFASYRWEARVTPVSGEPGLFDLDVRVIGSEGEFALRSRRFVSSFATGR